MKSHFLLLQYLLHMSFGDVLKVDYRTSHCYAVKSGAPKGWLNRVCHAGTVESAEIHAIKDFFGPLPFTWIVPENDMVIRTLLESHNFRVRLIVPAMHAIINYLTPYDFSPAVVVKAITFDQLEQWLVIVSESYECSIDHLRCFILHVIKKADSYLKLYLAFYDNIPVGAGMFIYHGNIVSVHKIATLPAYQRKGIASLLVYSALQDAYDNGCREALLLSSEEGKKLYQRLGFTSYASYVIYGNYH